MGDQASDLESLERILGDASAEPTRLSYALIKFITNGFSEEIGGGGFAVVYLGILPSGKVAVKKLTIAHDFSDERFHDEVNCLMRAKHNNIVRFLGYCADTQGELMEHNGRNVMAEVRQRLLCFEYVPNGSLHRYLKERPHGNEWKTRYKLIKGVCQGLQYLHKERINHLDLKPENVLLDAHMEPRITDFGLSRSFDEGQSRIFTKSTAGTRGYIAPEIIDRGEISFKSDIFSLGIIIIKLLTGSANNDIDNWDKSIDTDGPEVKSCIEIARTCVDADQHNRPSIDEIIDKLNEMEIVQESRNDTAGPFMYQNKECPSAPKKLNQDTEKTKTETSKLQFNAHMDHPRDVGGKCQKISEDAQMMPTPEPQHQAVAPMRVDPKTVKFSLPEDDGASKLDDQPDDGADKDGTKTRLVGMPPNAAGVDEKGGNGVDSQPTGSNNSGRGEKVNGIGDPVRRILLPPSPLQQTITRPNMVGSAGFPAVGPTGHPQMGIVHGMAAGGLPPTGFYQGGGGGPGSMPAGVENLRAAAVAGNPMALQVDNLRAAAAAGNPMALQQFVALIQHHQHQHQHHQQQIHMILMNGGHGGAGYPQMGYRPPVSYPMTPHLQQTEVKPPPPHLQPTQVKPTPPQFPVAVRQVQPPSEDEFMDDCSSQSYVSDDIDDDEEDARVRDADGRRYNEARPPNARRAMQTRENNNGTGKYEVAGQTNTINRGIAPTGRSYPMVAAPSSMGGNRMLHQSMMGLPNTMVGRQWPVDRQTASVQGVPTVCVSPALHLGSEGGAPSRREMRQVAAAAENSMALQQQLMALMQRQQMGFYLVLVSFLFVLTVIIIITVKARR
ncbi:hypothetical protein ZWY2020_050666 [Hordeum vulgare]|nr:hypothetical protein ZWY2020_050666 [Hordeum vulgare]